MPEHELWITALFNNYLAGVGNQMLSLAGMATSARPWANFVTMQAVVAVILVAMFTLLRPKLSVDRPGKLQHLVEVLYGFIRGEADSVVGHGSQRYVAFFATLFFFILFSNLLGVIPTFESPTMFPYVPAGCAIATFIFYNIQGVREQGAGKYLAHFAGPVPLMAPLMAPIELISHCARPLSLTIRLFANMYAGEQVTMVFLGLTYFVAPAVFMGLHVFVSFLQAYVFTLLTMVYVGQAVEHAH